ncbi:unnamed protein product [Pedinophyceae sp. YPF-701]|nr:unnamed protein product [Pedinophyceae sp. YPF-701]
MGVQSRMRKKRGVAKVSRKTKNRGQKVSKLPEEFKKDLAVLEKGVGVAPTWNELDTVEDNYVRNGILRNANASFGRNRHAESRKQEARRVREEAGAQSPERDDCSASESDDELRALLSKTRKTGVAAPKRLTPTQVRVVEELIAAHGDDVARMARDIKRNKMQHTEGKLRMMIRSYNHWGNDPANRHDFRVPRKGLW